MSGRRSIPGVKRLHIELDNGPEVASSRTQFLKRMVEFVDRHRVAVELVYLPPYHSKYNPIERCWGILERHWNGALLSSVADVLRWAGTMTWRGLRPIIRETTAVYERGVRLTKAAFRPIADATDPIRNPAQVERHHPTQRAGRLIHRWCPRRKRHREIPVAFVPSGSVDALAMGIASAAAA